jgi:hypothetical protein
MTRTPHILLALLAATAFVGCSRANVNSVNDAVDDLWAADQADATDKLNLADHDGLLRETDLWIEALDGAVAGHTLELPFDGETIDSSGIYDAIAPLVLDLVDAIEDTATTGAAVSTIVQSMVEELPGEWDLLPYVLSLKLADALESQITLATLQPDDFLWESPLDGCNKARIDSLVALSVDLVGLEAEVTEDGLELVLLMESPAVVIDEMRLWHRTVVFDCAVRTVEDFSFGLDGFELPPTTWLLQLGDASAAYHWPTVSASATGWCGETATLSSTIHDVLYGAGGPASAAGFPTPGHYLYTEIRTVEVAPEPLAFDAFTLAEKIAYVLDVIAALEVDLPSFWDTVQIATFVAGLGEELAAATHVVTWEAVSALFSGGAEELLDSSGGGLRGRWNGLHGDHVALSLTLVQEGDEDDDEDEVDPTDFSFDIPAFVGDTDLDTVLDPIDNCPDDSNRNQKDTDFDGVGDACDDVLDATSAGISFQLGRWQVLSASQAQLVANARCGAVELDLGHLFDRAGLLHPSLLEVLTDEQIRASMLAIDELIQRIHDRYDERWPGEEQLVAVAVQEWLAGTPLTLQQLQLVVATLDATAALVEAELGDGAPVLQQVGVAQAELVAHIQSQPGW